MSPAEAGRARAVEFPLELKYCLPGRLLFHFLFLFLTQNSLKITVSYRSAVPQLRRWLHRCLSNTLAPGISVSGRGCNRHNPLTLLAWRGCGWPRSHPKYLAGLIIEVPECGLGCWVGMPGQSFPARPVPASSPQGERSPSTGSSGRHACPSVPGWAARCTGRSGRALLPHGSQPGVPGWQEPSGVSGDGPPACVP